MQDGTVTVEARKGEPDVWCFGWRELDQMDEEYIGASSLARQTN
jgi:hypothetical protein